MFDNLTEKFDGVIKKLRGHGKISEENIAETLREVRRILLDADVNFKVTKQFIDDVRIRALGKDVLQNVSPGQLFVKILNDELIKLMGETNTGITFAPTPPTVILIAGLQGSGKTTFSAKLAHFLKSKGRMPLLVAADIYRPAAIDQLDLLGKQSNIPVYIDRNNDAVSIVKDAVNHARENARDVVIVDTAGRMHIDEKMMDEVAGIRDAVKPGEILFVVDSMTGQDAVNTAKAFHDLLDFSGVVLTKLDGDTRGGAALSVRAVVEKPIKFVGVGERIDALEPFYPDRMASRILGMGDIVTLVEKAQQQVDEKKALDLERKLRKAEFTFEDFLDQLQQLKNMGPLSDVLSMIPGMSKMTNVKQVDDGELVRVEAIIKSMTAEERRKPQIINGSRRRRIAMGSGTTIQEVNRLLKQFSDMQKMMKSFAKGKGTRKAKNLMRGMGGGMRMPFGS
jgi:signal recognition particle subunit SRP54